VVRHHLTPSQAVQAAPYIDHWVLQMYNINPDLINNTETLLTKLNQVVDNLGLTRVSDHSHYFHPGVSTVIILSESHLSAHTWPELGYFHVDIVTCEPKLTPETLEREFKAAFHSDDIHMVELSY